MDKKLFMNIIKRKIEFKALNDLNKIKANHSKVMDLEHLTLRMQNYLMPNDASINIDESQLIFRLRGKMTKVKTNFKGIYDKFECRACHIKEEDQKHIYECKLLNKKVSEIEFELI